MSAAAVETSQALGEVTQVIGPVVDVKFVAGDLPEINTALRVTNAAINDTEFNLVLEVALHLVCGQGLDGSLLLAGVGRRFGGDRRGVEKQNASYQQATHSVTWTPRQNATRPRISSAASFGSW